MAFTRAGFRSNFQPMKKLILVVAALVLHALLAGEDKFALKCNDFAFKFYKTVLETRSNENFVFSPVSVYGAGIFLCSGSSGETSKGLGAALDLGDSAKDDLNGLEELANIVADIGKKRNCFFRLWDFAWMPDGCAPSKNFADLANGVPWFSFGNADFSDPAQASRAIRGALLKKSGNILKVADIEIPQGTSLAVQSFALFDGIWEVPFELENTEVRPFLPEVGRRLDALMMDSAGSVHKYYDYFKFEAARLAYKGGRMSMVVLVPKGMYTFKNAVSTLDAEEFEYILKAMDAPDAPEASVTMPRFKLDGSPFSLKEPFAALGAAAAFSPDADFAPLSPALKKARLGLLTHKAAISVNEKHAVSSESPPTFAGTRKRLVANRPFIFFIVENKSGMICFMGHVYDPSQR